MVRFLASEVPLYGGPRGGAVSDKRGTPVHHRPTVEAYEAVVSDERGTPVDEVRGCEGVALSTQSATVCDSAWGYNPV